MECSGNITISFHFIDAENGARKQRGLLRTLSLLDTNRSSSGPQIFRSIDSGSLKGFPKNVYAAESQVRTLLI